MLSYHKRNAQTTVWKSKERIAKKSIVLSVMLRQVFSFFTPLDDVLGRVRKTIFKNSIALSVMLRHVLIFFAAADDVLPEPAD
jgi:hypothetical protein